MYTLAKRLKEVDITLFLVDMEKNGYYVSEWKSIFVNEKLSEEKMKIVILHELKHAISHDDISYLYSSFVYRIKMEKEANDFMLTEMINDNGGFYDQSEIIQKFRLGLGNHFEQNHPY